MWAYLKSKLLSFYREEKGQAALFAALTIFCVFVTVGVLIGVGEATTAQMRVQHAADAAVYSGAAVEADCLAQIAWINEGMSELYYQGVKAAADNVAAYTAFALARAPENPFWHPEAVKDDVGGAMPPVTAFSGKVPNIGTARANADSAYLKAQELINPDSGTIVEWLGKLALIQRSIAIAAPDLVQHQICHSVQTNFYADDDRNGENDEKARVAFFPAEFSFYPEDMGRHDVIIEKLDHGWKLTSKTDPAYSLTVTYNVNGNVTEYELDWTYPDDEGLASKSLRYREEKFIPAVSIGCDGNCVNKHSQKVAEYEVVSDSDNYNLRLQVFDDNNDGTADAVYYQQNGTSRCLEPLKDGVAINKDKYQWDADGYLTKNGKKVNETTSIEVNGVQVPVSIPDWMDGVKLGSQPIEFTFDRIHFMVSGVDLDMHIKIFPAGPVQVRQDYVTVHWLSTVNCDGRWRDRERQQKGKNFHRMKQLSENTWQYETITVGSYLTDMSWRKMFTRAASRHNDLPVGWNYVPTGPGVLGGDPLDIDEEGDAGTDDSDWMQNSEAGDNPWREFPEWARPARVPYPGKSVDAAQLNFGGFMDIDRARPASYEDGDDYAFSATCPAFYPRPVNKYTTGVPDNLKYRLPRLALRVGVDSSGKAQLSDATVTPLYRMYFPKDEDLSTAACEANGYPDSIDNYGNPFPGYWIEGPFKRRKPGDSPDKDIGTLEWRIERYAAGFDSRPWQLDPEDKNTYVSFPCMAFSAATASGSEWFLLVFDPLGAVPLFRQEPFYYGALTDFYGRPDRIPNMRGDWEKIAKAPTYVRRALGPYFSGMRNGSVKEILLESGKLEKADPKKDWFVASAMAMNLSDFDPGMEALSELFRRPLVVGVHAPSTFGWLASLFGADRDKLPEKTRDLGLGNPLYVIADEGVREGQFNSRKWTSGHFAFAAARLFFASPNGGEMVSNFAYVDGGAQYQSEFSNSYNLIKAKLSGTQQKWQKSTCNLFEPTWTASLVPLNAAVRLEDLYADADEGEINTQESSVSYILRQLRRVEWRRGMAANAHGNMRADYRIRLEKITAPPMQGRSHGNPVDFYHSGAEQVFYH